MTRMDWDKSKRATRASRDPSKTRPIGTYPPSLKQLRYLRSLSEQTGRMFIAPASSAAAQAEIQRLKKHPKARASTARKSARSAGSTTDERRTP